MMKVYYLSSSAFADNQINLLHHFPKEISVTYNVIIPVKNSNYSEAEISAYCREKGIDFIPTRLKYRFRDPRLLITYYGILENIRRVDPDVIFVANFDQIYLNAILLALDKKKTVIAMHDVVNHSHTAFDKLTTIGKKLLIGKFDTFLTYSAPQASILRSKYGKKKVYSIPLPLIGFGDMPVVEKAVGKKTFLFFGFILHYKGLDLLLHAINKLAEKRQDFQLIIAGRSSEWQEKYAPLIQHPELVSAHIGFIENHDIPAYFAQADYLVLPYRDTTQSGPLMIAYNYNIPVLASNAEGFHEFFQNGTTGYMFDLARETDLVRVLDEAIDRPEEEYLELKQKLASHTEDNFAISKLVTAYTDMFKNTTS
ncbi:glycosyltransferase family 4 protein [Arcticibacter sp.]|uniref:glycosyltransferase family 4 protein n=1 Tax=Arcticibacter sp. TaxID=1872630 RepID=UPI00388F60B1